MAHKRMVLGVVVVAMLMSSAVHAQATKRDTVANGIANGAMIGGASAFTFVKVAEARCGPGCEGPDEPLALYATIGGAGIGAAAGLFIDMLRKPKPSAPSLGMSPTLSAKRKGVVMRVRW